MLEQPRFRVWKQDKPFYIKGFCLILTTFVFGILAVLLAYDKEQVVDLMLFILFLYYIHVVVGDIFEFY